MATLQSIVATDVRGEKGEKKRGVAAGPRLFSISTAESSAGLGEIRLLGGPGVLRFLGR